MGRHSPSRKKVEQKQARAREVRASVRTAQAQRRAGVPPEPEVDPAFLEDDEDDADDASGTLTKMRSGIKTAAGTGEPAKRRSPVLGIAIGIAVIAAIVGFMLAR